MATIGRLPVDRQPGREPDGVRLGDADVEEPVGHGLLQQVQPGAGRHGGGDAHHALVRARQFDHRLAETPA